MRRTAFMLAVVLAVGIFAGAIGNHVLNAQQEQRRVTQLLKTDLPGIQGMDAYILNVEIAPGGQSGKHRHPGHDIMYILEGSAIVEVEGKPPFTLKQGEVFYNRPPGVHNTKNTSTTAPLKVVGFLILETGQPITIPVP